MSDAAGSDDAVDGGDAPAGALVAQQKPVDGARLLRADVGARGGLCAVEFAALEEVPADLEGGHAGGVEEVDADLLEGRDAREGEVCWGGEGTGGGGAEAGSAVRDERQRGTPEGVGGEAVEELDGGEGSGAGVRVEGRGVVEGGEGTGGGGGKGRRAGSVRRGAGVVLNAVAEGEVL